MFFVSTITTKDFRSKNERIELLLAEIAEGKIFAMGELYDLIKTDVFAYALSKTANYTEAEDVSQETFVKVYKYARQYLPKGKPMAWIITIELNIIRRQFQLKSRTVSIEEGFEKLSCSEDMEGAIATSVFINDMLKLLNEDEREIIVLHDVSGFKHREIAELVEKPLATVLSKYNRAIKKLQNLAKEDN